MELVVVAEEMQRQLLAAVAVAQRQLQKVPAQVARVVVLAVVQAVAHPRNHLSMQA